MTGPVQTRPRGCTGYESILLFGFLWPRCLNHNLLDLVLLDLCVLSILEAHAEHVRPELPTDFIAVAQNQSLYVLSSPFQDDIVDFLWLE